MADNMRYYENLQSLPEDAKKPIQGGRLKGMTDINPQWRYEMLTKEFGPCGFGWRYENVKSWTQEVPSTKELMVFAEVALYVKEGDEWSAPIPGIGGSYLIVSDRSGLHGSDEGYKMAVTDALSVAAKMLGVGADVYRGKVKNGVTDYKYAREAPQAPSQKPQNTPQQPKQQQPIGNTAEEKKNVLKALNASMKKDGMGPDEMRQLIQWKFKKNSSAELDITECKLLAAKYQQLWEDMMQELGGKTA